MYKWIVNIYLFDVVLYTVNRSLVASHKWNTGDFDHTVQFYYQVIAVFDNRSQASYSTDPLVAVSRW